MSKIIKFPLKMADGAQVKTIEELRGHFDLADVIRYYHDGRLCKWLKAWYYDEEADRVEQLDSCSEDFKKDLCDILGVPYLEDRFSNVDIDDISKKNERLERLKQFTADDKILESVDNVAFTQEEMMVLLGRGERIIYLCGKQFVIPGDIGYITYVGVNNCMIEFSGNAIEAGIDVYNMEFDIGSFLVDISDNIDLDKCFRGDNSSEDTFYLLFAANHVLGTKLLRLAAEKGDVNAQIYLGMCYAKGFGVDENKEEAIKWYRKAAEQGQVKMQKILGDYYKSEIFGEKNDEEAVKWYRKAAAQGDAGAQDSLDDCYTYGDVAEWYLKSFQEREGKKKKFWK